MPIEDMLRHTLVIERPTSGAVGERGLPAEPWGVLATVKGLIQPEALVVAQRGVAVSDHTAYLLPTDVKGSDRLRFEPDDGRRFYVDGVRDAAGIGHHLELDVHLVAAA
jgi:hypothetical protein